MKEPNREVTVTFSCLEKQAVDFKIRVKYDGLTQSSFFQEVLRTYLEGDPEFFPILEKIKLKRARMGKAKSVNSIKEMYSGQQILKDLGITESDRSALFDLIEEKE
tara:strand:+ start:1767 stop:2084 length:318 start_codon:yes stop_codon:yes gene_type:complete